MAFRSGYRQKKALYFKGNNDWLERTDSGAGIANLDPEPDEAFSYFTWLQPLWYSATNYDGLFTKQGGAGTGFKGIKFGYETSGTSNGRSWTDTLGVYLISNKGSTMIMLSCSAGSSSYTALRRMGWSHVGFTYDGTGTTAGLKMYINALDVTTQLVLNGGSAADFIDTAGGAEFGTTDPLLIGSDTWNESEKVMCQIGVWDIALSAAQVREIYNGPNDFPGACDLTLLSTSSNLIGYWLGDDPADTYSTIQDRSGNNFDLTSSGMTAGQLMPFRMI